MTKICINLDTSNWEVIKMLNEIEMRLPCWVEAKGDEVTIICRKEDAAAVERLLGSVA